MTKPGWFHWLLIMWAALIEYNYRFNCQKLQLHCGHCYKIDMVAMATINWCPRPADKDPVFRHILAYRLYTSTLRPVHNIRSSERSVICLHRIATRSAYKMIWTRVMYAGIEIISIPAYAHVATCVQIILYALPVTTLAQAYIMKHIKNFLQNFKKCRDDSVVKKVWGQG